ARPLGQGAQDAPSIHHRHHDVEQDHVGHGVLDLHERRLAVGCQHRLVPGRLQVHAQQQQDVRLVVDYEDLAHEKRTAPSPGTTSPMSTDGTPWERRMSWARMTSSGGITATIPTPRLNTRAISSSLTSPMRRISSKI